ncbi:MAG: hypothetical protein JOY74_03240 [Sinobacteraceae bacterium]|nr:hypothetical protein [Nevskiaceae bacterium]MBV9316583.1 hypothetical protein [Gammaproteobacteria bacterium]
MSTRTTASYARALRDADTFSIVHGGPLFQLLLRARLSGDALDLVVRRVILFVLISWAPLLALSAFGGHLLDGNIALPFLLDIETHIRFLVVVPLLLLAELVVHRRLLPVARAFLDRDLISEADEDRFDAAINSAFRLRNSVLVEVLLLVFVYVVGVLVVWRQYTSLNVSTWYGQPAGEDFRLHSAGIWYAYVSLPIFQFLLLRWYFRIFIWIRFLWQVARLNLTLVPTHPDQLAGLGFLGNTVFAFSVLLMAHGAMVASQIANRIFFAGATLMEFKEEIFVVLLFLLCLVFGPLLVFSPQLSRAKRRGLLEYGSLAERYVREFDDKWLRGARESGEPLMGSADIQSLADMGNSFTVVRSMRLAPISRDAVLELSAAVLVPLTPLLLTIMPVEQLVKRLLGLVF